MGSLKKKVGVKDIAAKAGVSIGTVDRVLHNRGEVKKETREKVMAIVNELGYKPNVLAKSLASKKITKLAIVIPDSSDNNPYWEKPIIGINKAAEELKNYNVEIIYEFFDASNEESYKSVLKSVCDKNPDGIVLNPVFKSVSLHYISIFKEKEIPYTFIDINIKGVSKLGYFGQDAEQSGLVAAKLMSNCTRDNANILVVKQSKNKIFSQHIESRVTGFIKFFDDIKDKNKASILNVEIDLQDCDEPDFSLNGAFKQAGNFDGIFVPNSRVFKVAEYIENKKLSDIVLIGYDLVDKNVKYLKKEVISFLISQKPEEQAYNSILALFNKLVAHQEVQETTFSPIDIIIKENIDYYNQKR